MYLASLCMSPRVFIHVSYNRAIYIIILEVYVSYFLQNFSQGNSTAADSDFPFRFYMEMQ